jgi:hypothetical protein
MTPRFSNAASGDNVGVDVFWGRLHRMILVELIKIFTLALIALTGLILMAGIKSELQR